MRLLNLCSGTGSVAAPFKQSGWEVIEVDWDPRYKPTHVVNLMTWDCPYEAGFFDCIWCSPDCTHYSIARTTAKTPRDLVKADALVQRCLDLIQMLAPQVWWIENPDTGLLKGRPCVQGLPFCRVDYCMYGAPYRKRTRLWTNCTEPGFMLCNRSHLISGRHAATAQRGGRRNEDDATFTRDELHRLPQALCEEIYSICQSYCTIPEALINAETAQGGDI